MAMAVTGNPVDRRRDALAALGHALAGRSPAMARLIADRWEENGGFDETPGAEELRSEIERFTMLATDAVVNHLVTHQPATQEQADALSQTGRAPVDERLSLAGITKLYLFWRDAAELAICQEAARLRSAERRV